VKSFVGGAAESASARMGAEAFATGNAVGFSKAPDLHTAAHEAAHVVQQRGEVQLKGGVGEEGDAHEQHADQVADAVVAGKSAEPLLSKYTPPGGDKSGGGLQLKAKPWATRKAEFLTIIADLLTKPEGDVTHKELNDLKLFLDAVTDEKKIDEATHLGFGLSKKETRNKERFAKLVTFYRESMDGAPEPEANAHPNAQPEANAHPQANPMQPQAPPPPLVVPQPQQPLANQPQANIVAAQQQHNPQAPMLLSEALAYVPTTMPELLAMSDAAANLLTTDTSNNGKMMEVLKGPFEANWFKAKSCLVFGKWPGGNKPKFSTETGLKLMTALTVTRGAVAHAGDADRAGARGRRDEEEGGHAQGQQEARHRAHRRGEGQRRQATWSTRARSAPTPSPATWTCPPAASTPRWRCGSTTPASARRSAPSSIRARCST